MKWGPTVWWREQALSHGAGQHFQRQIFFPPKVHRQLRTVSGKQKSLVISPRNVMILKVGKKIHQLP